MATRGIEAGMRTTALAQKYSQVRATTLRLAQPLSAEDQMLQSMPDASPVKWHLAHTTWFFETFILAAHADGYVPLDPRFRQLFNSYYKQVGSHPYRGARGLMSRPTLEEVHTYRLRVDQAMLALLEVANDEAYALVEIGLNHEQQHQELILTDLKHMLSHNPLRPVYVERASASTEAAPLGWQDFAEGVYWIGHAGADFAFDNEQPRHRQFIHPFRLATRPVTNAEYLDFMHDGGYSRPEFWLSMGWATVQQERWEAPMYWEEHDGTWFHFTLSGFQPVDPSETVVHLSYFEADAYARWAGARLPTEAEWELAATGTSIDGNFAEDRRFHPRTIAANGSGLSALFGDVWEWTQSSYSAYPGFRTAPGALGEYNGKFMCNQYVLRGGSCATPRSHIRATYRNFFPPDARWQFSGVRLAKDA
jgi:ergothioneine biosynthesis protein EgtB